MAGNNFPVQLHSTFFKKVSNFPVDIYNFNDGDNLTTLMQILLGNSGTGQLRNIQTAARITQEILEFSDLDQILGTLLNVSRVSSEVYSFPTNPFIDQLQNTQWQEIARKDARYRERLLGAAEAFQMGSNLWGILTLAEALSGVKFYLTESWRSPGYGRSSLNQGQEIVLIPLIDNAGVFVWSQAKARYILQAIHMLVPSNFIVSFGTPKTILTNVPLSNVAVNGNEPSGYSEYFYLQPTVTATATFNPAIIPVGANTRYWLVNGQNIIAPYFAHLQSEEIVIDVTGSITSVSSTDTAGIGAPSDSVALPSLQITSTLYGAQ